MSEESTGTVSIPLVRNEKGELEIHMADVNATNKNGFTALMRAIQNRHPEVAQALIDAGADVKAKDNEADNEY